MSKRGGKYNDKMTCETCQGKYSRSNKSTHNKTKRHQQALKYEAIIKNTLHQQLPKKNDLSSRIESSYYDWNGEKIYMTNAKFDYYNTVSMAKNGYPLYFKTQSDRRKVLRDFEETGSEEDNEESRSEEDNEETNSENDETDDEESEDSLSIESDSDDENTMVRVPDWFIKKLDDPKTPREELKKMLLIYNKLAINQGAKPVKLKKK